MSNKVRIGILGCGPRGLQMAWITQLLDDCCELTCMSDPDEKALAKAKQEFPECALYSSSEELLHSGKADAVITEIPPAIHTEYVVKALKLNIHVLGEIPAVETLEEAELLWKTVQESKALYMCGANANYRVKTPFAQQLRDLGVLGKVAYVETEYMHDMRTLTDNWRKTYESCRYCTHSLGPVLALLGDDEIATVSCMTTGDIINCGRSHNAMSALFQTRKGVVIRFLTAFALPQKGPHHTTRILCEKGILELYNEKARVWLKDMDRFS
ncbi:MAG: Gfo/Idh/MocA family oxidoreductase, partial [Lentisphaeria bacterium]|nr:Gfo/Idh/MocA family oxidoreductase [Lentisphaeria bacterium]